MKLVDADLLKAELEKELEKFVRENENCGKPALFVYIHDMYLRLMCKIDSLESCPNDELVDEIDKIVLNKWRTREIIFNRNDLMAFTHYLSKWQKEKTINSACEYLQQHREEVRTEDNGIAGWIDDEFIGNFRKTMNFII